MAADNLFIHGIKTYAWPRVRGKIVLASAAGDFAACWQTVVVVWREQVLPLLISTKQF